MKRILAYQRSQGSTWVAFPRTSAAAAQRFVLIGQWHCLQIAEGPEATKLVWRERT